MNTLQGRPIGLKAKMTGLEMQGHLIQKIKEWTQEGFSKPEIDNAIITKCKPLIFGYYWHRSPEASNILEGVLKDLGLEIEQDYNDSMRSFRKALNKKVEIKEKQKEKTKEKVNNFLEQF